MSLEEQELLSVSSFLTIGVLNTSQEGWRCSPPNRNLWESCTCRIWPVCSDAGGRLGRTRVEHRTVHCTRMFQACVVSMCDLHCYFILHLYDINPAEYLVKQLQAVSFKETSDSPKTAVSPGT